MTHIKRILLPVLCLVLGACGGPSLSLKLEQHYDLRGDEDRLFKYHEWRQTREATAICILFTGFETLPNCSPFPWTDLFYVSPIAPGSQDYYLKGQSSTYALEPDDTASLKPLCSASIERFPLVGSERRAIAAVADSSGFFDLPAGLSKLPSEVRTDGLDTIVIRSMCTTNDLDLSIRGRRHRVHWDCDTALSLGQEDAAAPRQIGALLEAIERAYAAHSDSALLPFMHCPTMDEELARRRDAQR